MNEEVDIFLEHHGVKGMKWGIRRSRSVLKSRKPIPRPSDEGRAVAKILEKQKKYGTAALTNHELRTLNARQALEKQFSQNNPKPPGKLEKVKKGEKVVKDLLAVGGTAVAVYKFSKDPHVRKMLKIGANTAANPKTRKVLNQSAKVVMSGTFS